MPWYQSKYAKGFVVAFCTGLISATIMHLGIIDDVSLSVRQTVKIDGLAFMAPFASLIRFLPSFETIFGQPPAQINVERVQNMPTTVNAPTDPPPSPNPAAVNSQSPPPARNPHGQYAKRVPSVDAVSDS